MAKITAKFRVADYSFCNNFYNITFKLRPTAEYEQEFTLVYDENQLSMPDDTRFFLIGLGLTNDIDQIMNEAHEWLWKPRAKYGNWSWDHALASY